MEERWKKEGKKLQGKNITPPITWGGHNKSSGAEGERHSDCMSSCRLQYELGLPMSSLLAHRPEFTGLTAHFRQVHVGY